MSDSFIRGSISTRLKIPEEVLRWKLEERIRFVDNMKQESVPIYRARCLLVGCARAGKTTVLRNLKRNQKGKETEQPPETTVGLDVHQDLFVLGQSKKGNDSTLFDYEGELSPHRESLMSRKRENDNKKLLSVMDFAGQVAYYACHQVYLSRRAIYLLVVDMSQDLNEKLQQKDKHCVQGTLFEDWTALEYFTFWLQTIRTYGQEDIGKRHRTKSDSSERGKTLTPVIVLATHKDSYNPSKDTSAYGNFYVKLRKQLPERLQNIANRYFELELPPKERTQEELQKLEEVRRYIAKTTESLSHWGEKVPKQWCDFEQIIQRSQKLKISSRKDLLKLVEYFAEEDFDDMLRFYHEIGMILFFPDLGDDVILDIQWFIDAFKYIITDQKHVSDNLQLVTHEDWDQFFDCGVITEPLMLYIWEEISKDSHYYKYLHKITPFMEKLGILAKMDKRYTEGKQCYYIPSMNKRKLGENWTGWKKTHILSFYFKTYLPHFFFFRLVVACFAIWGRKKPELYKNIALFHGNEKDEFHTVAVAVNKTSIQLQVLTPAGDDLPLLTERTRDIRLQIEKKIAELTKTFHGNVNYEIGFPCLCKPISITEEDEKSFFSEKKLLELPAENPPCPRCGVHSNKRIKKKELLEIWGK